MVLLLLLSCKKENSKRWTEITIKVNNYITGEPIDENVICGIVYYKNEKLPWKKDGDVVLDAGSPVNGVYHYAFKAPKAIQHAEFDWNSDNLYGVDVNQFMYYEIGKKNEYQQYLVPYGYMREVYINTNCYDDNDSIYIHYIKNISLPNYTPGVGGYFKGCDVNYINPYELRPIGKYEYKYSVTKNSITETFIDTYTVEENGYAELRIEY